jgi:hypothetical protein
MGAVLALMMQRAPVHAAFQHQEPILLLGDNAHDEHHPKSRSAARRTAAQAFSGELSRGAGSHQIRLRP